jgi:hypothetical protein
VKSSIGSSLLATLPLLGLLVALAWWNPSGDFWGSVEPPKAQCEAYDYAVLKSSKVLSEEVYDRRKLRRLFREPQNTVSNLAYVIVGMAILFAGTKPVTKSLGWACMFLGLVSGFYHASLLPEWRLLDILGVYATLFSLLTVGVAACFPRGAGLRSSRIPPVFVWGAAFLCGIYRNDFRIAEVKFLDSTYVVVATVALASALALAVFLKGPRFRRHWWTLLILACSASIAFAAGLGDRFGGFLASPDALVQGHTVWHVLGAAATLAAYELFAGSGVDRSVFESARVIIRAAPPD